MRGVDLGPVLPGPYEWAIIRGFFRRRQHLIHRNPTRVGVALNHTLCGEAIWSFGNPKEDVSQAPHPGVQLCGICAYCDLGLRVREEMVRAGRDEG